MKTRLLTALLLGSSALGFAGLGALAQDKTITIESWRNDDLAIWQEKLIPAFEKAEPGHQGGVRAVGADRIQRRAQRQARRRLGGRPHHLPSVRRLARALQQGPSRRPERAAGHGELLRRRQVRLADRRRQGDLLRADGLGHPRLHLQQGRLRQARHRRAGDRGRVLRRARQDQGRRHLHPAGHGHQGSLGSRDHGLPEHRPELLEGRGRPPGADQGRAEADRSAVGRAVMRRSPSGSPISATASRRRPIRTARTCSRSAAPRSIRPVRGRSRASTRRPSSRWAPSRRR